MIAVLIVALGIALAVVGHEIRNRLGVPPVTFDAGDEDLNRVDRIQRERAARQRLNRLDRWS